MVMVVCGRGGVWRVVVCGCEWWWFVVVVVVGDSSVRYWWYVIVCSDLMCWVLVVFDGLSG